MVIVYVNVFENIIIEKHFSRPFQRKKYYVIIIRKFPGTYHVSGLVSWFLGFFNRKVSVTFFESVIVEKHFLSSFQRYIMCHNYYKLPIDILCFRVSFKVFGFFFNGKASVNVLKVLPSNSIFQDIFNDV